VPHSGNFVEIRVQDWETLLASPRPHEYGRGVQLDDDLFATKLGGGEPNHFAVNPCHAVTPLPLVAK
jgi:hypothetical protein